MDTIILDVSLISFLGLMLSWLFLPTSSAASTTATTTQHVAATA
jgi:hypothetical protein